MGVAHWDEVECPRRAKDEMDASWQWLGPAAGTRGVGPNELERNKIFCRGVGVIGRIETLDYGDGEPLEDD